MSGSSRHTDEGSSRHAGSGGDTWPTSPTTYIQQQRPSLDRIEMHTSMGEWEDTQRRLSESMEDVSSRLSARQPLSVNTDLDSSTMKSSPPPSPSSHPGTTGTAKPPARAVSALKRPTNSPNSPGTRDRGYSLRRVLFTKGVEQQAEGIELEGSESPSSTQPSTQPLQEQGKRPDAEVTATPISEEFELPPRPPPKKTFGANIFSKLDIVHRQRAPHSIISKIEGTFQVVKRKAFRIREVRPSKDGRHLSLDVTRQGHLIDERTATEFVCNVIRSSRYTPWNFLPRQLMFQFGKVANFYFLVISILQMIPGLSTTGTYTTIVPLLVFISISMAKEGYDDLRRHKLDKAENNNITRVLKPDTSGNNVQYNDRETTATWAKMKWQDVRVGDIVRLDRDDGVPADMVMLHSDGANGIAYIETMALDGETNLKAKQASPLLAKRCKDIEGLMGCNAHIVVEDPNLDLYNFDGRVTCDGETLPLTTNEVVYRGSIMRNTSQAIGMVINTGEECKIRMNANSNPRIKSPSLQIVVNRVVIIVVIFVLCLASFCTIAYQLWYRYTERRSWYLEHAHVASVQILTSFIIMFNTMIPLSLYVSLEIIKVGQLFLMNDVELYDPVSNTPMEARTTTINEELGQVSYIFSDKTGTLTDNIMRFRKMSVAGTAWLHDYDLQREEEQANALAKALSSNIKGKGAAFSRMKPMDSSSSKGSYEVDIETNSIYRRRSIVAAAWKSTARPAKGQLELRTEDMLQYLKHHPHGVFARKARFFLLSLALCHTCLPETKEDGSTDFQASSPDELALVRAAQDLGYIVIDRSTQTITLKSHPNGPGSPELVETYEVLDVIEFSSKRKRMSIVVRFPDGRRCIFCKGADSVVMKRLKHASLASQKVTEVQRRASVRKSLEVESALRKMSDAVTNDPRTSIERTSFNLNRKSIGGIARNLSMSGKTSSVHEEMDTWLRNRENDVDLSSVDSPAAYSMPISPVVERRTSSASGTQQSTSSDDYFDGLVDESLAMNEALVFERSFQHIDDFATEGLRTLLYAYRFLDEQEYLTWKNTYHVASTSLVNRQQLVESAGEMIERDLDLAGATAIEDKLQNGVPETIDKLRRANIRLWMLTGDKRETAINIGHSCRLIKDYSNVIILDNTAGKVEQLMYTSLVDIQGGSIPHSVVVVDGQTLSDIESDDSLSELFFDLAVLADSVICCRASPSQKASLVKGIRTRVNGSVTLAIGDGANDIAMIQEAHVGIGITGKEGLQAARISDYSIAQFRFLQKLLLVHGRWNYIRTSKYVLGTFWKEMLFYLTQALFQRWNGYSGTSLYESWSMSFFNTFFTSLPVIILGIFEQDLRSTTLLAIPELYTLGQRNAAFGVRKYLWWTFMASAEAMVIYFLMYGLWALSNIDNVDLFSMGDLSYSLCVLIICTKLLFLEMHTKTIMSVAGWVLSVGGWTMWNVLLSLVYSEKSSTVYAVRGGLLGHFGKNPSYWLVIILAFLALLTFEIGVSAVRKAFFPSDVDIFQDLEQDPLLRKRFENATRGVQTDGANKSNELEGEIKELLDRRMDSDMDTGSLNSSLRPVFTELSYTETEAGGGTIGRDVLDGRELEMVTILPRHGTA